ncbi:hypothetical protein MTR67_049002 [Solanum verrucosum]|uniref:Rho-GAP domain-containing protein n=1 Tax=Solanum verrucosum TaxID=315347 RepID=A0AAF0V014_SOLVR|nr:hypothetical protein MTR67_049002 [Solanum verrucosum]
MSITCYCTAQLPQTSGICFAAFLVFPGSCLSLLGMLLKVGVHGMSRKPPSGPPSMKNPIFSLISLEFSDPCYGTKVEGILRQSADVEEVERRVNEYEQGKTEFVLEEDAHVIGDCVKHVLRELPSSPVPASCCTALLEAYKIDRKEARVNAMRSAIHETFPEPNRRLLQRILKMMHTISSHASENRMTPSAVAACMAPLLLRPLLAGECELEDDFDVSGDNSAQLLAAANAANNAQAIITTLLEEYENIFDDDNLHRCSISADSQIVNSGSEESSDDENLDMKDNGFHDAENEVDPNSDDDRERVLSGKLSESSGSAASDLYDYKYTLSVLLHIKHQLAWITCLFLKCLTVPGITNSISSIFQTVLHNTSFPISFTKSTEWHWITFLFLKFSAVSVAPAAANDFGGGDDSDVESPRDSRVQGVTLKPTVDTLPHAVSNVPFSEQLERCGNEVDDPCELAGSESQRSMGEILSSMDPAHGISRPDSSADKSSSKLTPSNLNVKKSTFWGRSNARKTPSVESIDSSGEEELAIQRLEITKNDLRHRIAKEARGNAILQASLERRKQALHERRLALEQDVARLQEQLQAERDLRAALEVGLSMSSGQLSGTRGMDSKTRAELEEIALAEADVARLKQKVAELHHQLNQQHQHHYGSLSDACERFQNGPNHNSQLKYFQQDFDTTLAFCNHERRQRSEELLGADTRNVKGQVLTSGASSRQPARKLFLDTTLSDSKSTEVSTSLSLDELGAVDSPCGPSTSRAIEAMDYGRHPSAASSTLVELTTRLDFFKERRSQLMEQLHSLDVNYGSTSQHFMYKPSSPPWN